MISRHAAHSRDTAGLRLVPDGLRDELEREKARQRTYDAMQRKARAGHVTGGRVFGYDNFEIVGPDGQRSHVERRINETEAAVVRKVFELCATGAGFTRIAKTLNEDGAAAPRPQQSRPAAWAPSSVREVLLRPLYRGEIVWNQTRKRDSGGQAKRATRPEDAWLHVPAPGLQIVSDELWQSAHRELQSRSEQYAQAGRQRHDGESRYLLTNFGRCARCGGSFAVQTRQHGGSRVALYGCSTAAKRGSKVCDNTLVARMEVLDREVLATLETDVLRPSVVEQAIEIALEELAPTGQATARERLAHDVATLERECERLARAMTRGGRLDALLGVLEQHQARLVAARRELASVAGFTLSVDRMGLQGRLRAKLQDWRRLLTADVASGRAVLRLLLEGPIRFTPIVEERGRGYAFEGAIAFDQMLPGVVDFPPCVASPTGTALALDAEIALTWEVAA
jgi:hypothetical protein